jgi:hypothetical protein
MRNRYLIFVIAATACAGIDDAQYSDAAVDSVVDSTPSVDAANTQMNVHVDVEAHLPSSNSVDVTAFIKLSCAGRSSVIVHTALSVLSEAGQDARPSTVFVDCQKVDTITVNARFNCYKQTFAWADVSVFDASTGSWNFDEATLSTECPG